MITSHLHNETAVIAAFREGDERAFATIYDHFYQRVYFFSLRFVQEQDAKDVTSEVFVKLWHKRDSFESLKGISNFLFVLARNRCLDIIKHTVVKNQKQSELVYLLESSEEYDLFLEQVRVELIRKIYEEVEKLPARMKEIFMLSFAEGLKPGEIAVRLKISVQTVSNQKLTAVRVLKAALGGRLGILWAIIALENC